MIGRIFVGIWRGLDGLRKFLHLLVLLTIFGFVVGALRTSIPHIADSSALVIAPKGEIVEQLSGSPVDQAIERVQGDAKEETLLWDLIDALKAAKKDSRIAAVVIDLDYMSGGGQPTLAEFTAAIKDFRSSGKKVVAHATSFLQESYYVASAADEIYLDPMGLVPSTATSATARITKSFWTRSVSRSTCSVSALTRAPPKSTCAPTCRRRSRGEPRVSECALAQLPHRGGRARGLTPTDISDYVANLVPAMLAAKGDAAKVALDAKLVTGLKSSLDVERRMVELVGWRLAARNEEKLEGGRK
jgi:protease-4